MSEIVRIWYVAPQRLCNFRCTYCVSTGDWSKDNTVNWWKESDAADVERVVTWIGARPFPVGVRLGSLGEPFASWEFLQHAAWLTRQPDVRFVELVTNGSLLDRRLPKLAKMSDTSKLSLWITYHHNQIDATRLVDAAKRARDEYGCFVVLNALLFADTQGAVADLREAASGAGLRVNVEPGYEPSEENGTYSYSDDVVSLSREEQWYQKARRSGVDPELLEANLIALDHVAGQPCSSGHDYIFIGIDGDVYPCSRYYDLGIGRLGNICDPQFQFTLRGDCWTACSAPNGCSNKEDFLQLKMVDRERRRTPSLGWLEPLTPDRR